jgi:hypothetical protein
MRKLTILGVALSAFLPVAAEARVSLGVRLGYAMAGGDAVKDGQMTDVIDGAIPIQLDLGYMVMPDLTIGAFFSYGFGRLGSEISDECDAFDLDCSASNMRLGVRGQYDFSTVSPTFVPWLGLGVGYEWANLEQSDGTDTLKLGFKGWEWVSLEVGGDYKLSPMARAGIFVAYSFGQYSSATLDLNGDSQTEDITDKGTHTYLTFGLRGQFDF